MSAYEGSALQDSAESVRAERQRHLDISIFNAPLQFHARLNVEREHTGWYPRRSVDELRCIATQLGYTFDTEAHGDWMVVTASVAPVRLCLHCDLRIEEHVEVPRLASAPGKGRCRGLRSNFRAKE